MIRELDADVPVEPEIISLDDEPENEPEDIPAGLEEDDTDSEDFDETVLERLWGLTEMFPSWLRNSTAFVAFGSVSGVKSLYGLSRNAAWIFFSSATVLMAPVIFEVERVQLEEAQKQQQRQILLGPNAAMTGGGSGHFPMPIPPGPTQSR